MVDSIDDITWQAHQGSVAAIIQVLNEKLSHSGIRARAVLAQGVLQLLCEAPSADYLERQQLVLQIRHILESIQPRHIYRVKINSRIVREQQLLWLEEINRDPENQLLWAEEIKLSKPNLVQRLVNDWKWQTPQSESDRIALIKVSKERLERRSKRQFWRGTLGGIAVSTLVLALGWFVYQRLGNRLSITSQAQIASDSSENVQSDTPEAEASTQTVSSDPFVQAVRIAEQAAQDGQIAQSSSDWLDLAARWQRASDLMGDVSIEDGRYQTAQDRRAQYQQNSEMSLRQAELLRSPSNAEPPLDP
jgi:hypothetical protein